MKGRQWILMDTMSSTHSQYLKAALYSYFNVQKPLGKFLSNGYHLLYFNPKHEETELSKDGYDSHQIPANLTFKRRLWTGGQIDFLHPVAYDSQAVCVESIQNSKSFGENHMVTIQREVVADGLISLVERRSLFYTNDLYKKSTPQFPHKPAIYTHELKPTDILLFRYSSLTFNAHRIHYNKDYAMREGYPNILVHGPLTVTLLLEWFSTLFGDLVVKSFKYKNIAPLFANESIKLCLGQTSDSKYDTWIENEDGELCVSGTIEVMNNDV